MEIIFYVCLLYIITFLTLLFFNINNLYYYRQRYNDLKNMIFIESEICIKGYLENEESATFYYWKSSKDFTIDTDRGFYMHIIFLFFQPYNLYWYFKFKKFILSQKTYDFLEFFHHKKKLFLSKKRDDLLTKILNN